MPYRRMRDRIKAVGNQSDIYGNMSALPFVHHKVEIISLQPYFAVDNNKLIHT